ncbi:hypothetical protein T07_7655 [Trichinella nelsoni]|uniref:Uncharacterized protein n=1 Tax=Trichinella nelsoni TaxID=6336 RepID=A0A0V0RRF9_9BILA|nr:hypothetical protein T07_7655 [Trichinella nelsoni]
MLRYDIPFTQSIEGNKQLIKQKNHMKDKLTVCDNLVAFSTIKANGNFYIRYEVNKQLKDLSMLLKDN